MKISSAVILMMPIFGAGCVSDDSDVFTLYRSSVVITGARIHVATFDAVDGEKYNNGNCDQARSLFQQQPGVLTGC